MPKDRADLENGLARAMLETVLARQDIQKILKEEKAPVLAWFEKLARNRNNNPLPLVASVSASSARLWSMLLHLKIFIRDDGVFDLDKAQMFANVIVGYVVYCGHHTVIEAMEVWNRGLDYLALNCPNILPPGTFEKPSVEASLPYGHVGGYRAFLHPSYAEAVLLRARQYEEKGDEWTKVSGTRPRL